MTRTMIDNLDQIIEGFQNWYQKDSHKESEDSYPQLRTKEFLSGLTRDEFIEFFFEFARTGGKIQSGGYRTAGSFKKAIEEKFDEFREFVLEPYQDNFEVDNWLSRIEDFKGFGQGISTIYLNRINKNRFIVVNNKSREALSILGYKIKSDLVGGYRTIEAAQKDLLSRYPELGNFFRADALTHFLIGTEEGRKFLPDPVNDLIEKYKQIKQKIGHQDEYYKYELVRFFQDNWAPDEAGLSNFIKEFIKRQDNMMYNLATSSLSKITENAPKETLLLFRELFDESKSLTDRIQVFSMKADELIKRFEPSLKGNQDERAISVYLTSRYPDRYTFYKYSYYSAYCKLLNIKEKPQSEKYIHYLELINDLKEKHLKGNNEVWSLTNATLPDTAWPDKNLNILAQDFLYITFRNDSDVNYWIFQGNPEYFDITGALRDNALKFWTVNSHKQRIKPGDKAILWVTGDKPGCYALCEVTSEVKGGNDSPEELKYYVSEPEDTYGDMVSITIENNLWNAYVPKERLYELPAFENFKAGNRGTNFEATKEQYEAILKIVQSGKPDGNGRGIGGSNNPKPEKMRKNLILFGPPGTGKTYKTINKALEIIRGKEYVSENEDNRINLTLEFNRLKEAGQIEFVTFHQSFSYEDFVEGIKPVMLPEDDVNINDGTGDVKYEIRDGIFKKICSRAKGISPVNRSDASNIDFDQADYFKMSVGGKSKPHIHDWCIKNNKLALGWGGEADHSHMKNYLGNWNNFRNEYRKRFPELVNESKYHIQAMYLFLAMKKGDVVLVSKGNKIVDAIGVIKSDKYIFDDTRDIGYCQFREVEWLATEMNAAPELFVNKNLMMQSIYQFYNVDINKEYFKRAFSGSPVSSEKEPYVLIIDEINRGNVASIFGELITLIEEDKRIGAENQLLVRLPYSGSDAESFGVPDNVYIIGTMNTADRSIEAMDTALRRRFSFEEVSPDPELLKEKGTLAPDGMIGEIDVVRMLTTINDRIEKLIDKDHKIGHSYFMGMDKEQNEEALKMVFRDKVIPLLEEYFYGDFGKIGLVLGGSFVEKVNTNGFQFARFPDYGDMMTDLMDKPVYRIKPSDDWDFKTIYS